MKAKRGLPGKGTALAPARGRIASGLAAAWGGLDRAQLVGGDSGSGDSSSGD